MPEPDPRVDAYIANSAEFAKPILVYLRQAVHAARPEVEETLKGNSPTFRYPGMLCGRVAFKQHCIFGFWKGSLVIGKDGKSPDSTLKNYGRPLRVFRRPTGGSTWSGSPWPKGRPPGSAGWLRRSNGWRRGSRGIGSM